MTIGYPDFSGTRLLHGTSQVLNKSQAGLGPGLSDVWTVPVTRPGYIQEIHLFNATDNVTKLPVSMQAQWLDGISGDNLDTQNWISTAGSSVGPHYVDGSGPTKGGQLQMTITNLAAAVNLGYFLLIDETSFAYQRHDWRTDNVFGFAPTGYTAPPASDMNTGVLWAANGLTIPANNTAISILPLYNGPVYVRLGFNGGAASVEAEADMSPHPGIIGLQAAWDFFCDANGQISQLAYMPRIQCQLTLTNHTAGALQAFGSIIVAER
jgi:hypothetical protein